MKETKIEFQTMTGAVLHLVGQDFRQDENGRWQRYDDGATAAIERLSFSVQVRIYTNRSGGISTAAAGPAGMSR